MSWLIEPIIITSLVFDVVLR